MRGYRRPLWYYPLFQIPFILFCLCSLLVLLFWLLGIGRPLVSVAIALDLSSSTYYNQTFNAPDSIMNREVQAVEAYLDKNTSRLFGQPNQIQVFGFGDSVRPLTRSFSNDNQQIQQELQQTLQQKDLANIIGGGTNLDLAIQTGTSALGNQESCRELLIVTDGEVLINPQIIAEAKAKQVKINAVIIGKDAPNVQTATTDTGGKYLIGEVDQLDRLFANQLFGDFNNNWRWVLWWLGLAWVCLMWMLVMPLDRWLFQGLLKMPINLSGRLALGNALFWTVVIPLIIWKLYQLFELALPFVTQC